MENNTSYLFRCKTTDAYIFKILTELLHNVIKTACFEITAKGISLRMMDSNRRTLIDILLKSEKFQFLLFFRYHRKQSAKYWIKYESFL